MTVMGNPMEEGGGTPAVGEDIIELADVLAGPTESE